MTCAKKGDYVLVHYTGKFDDGEEFDSSQGCEPLGFILGAGEVIEGFQSAVDGMKIGEKKTVKIAPEQAYGEYEKDKLISSNRENFGDDFKPQKNMQIVIELESGQQVMATVTKFDKKSVTLDLNHPLAGKALNFELELIDIKDPRDIPLCDSSCSSCSSCKGCS